MHALKKACEGSEKMIRAEVLIMYNPTSHLVARTSKQPRHLGVRDQAFTLYQFAGLLISAREQGRQASPLPRALGSTQDWRASTISYLDVRAILEELWLCEDRTKAVFEHAKRVDSGSFGTVAQAARVFEHAEDRIAFCARNFKTVWKATTEKQEDGSLKLFHSPKFFDPEIRSTLELFHFVNCASVVRTRGTRRERFLEVSFTADCGVGRSALEDFFGCQVNFDADIACLHFSPGLLHPQRHTAPGDLVDLRQLCESIERDIQNEDRTLYQLLVDSMPQISSSGDMARQIGVSRRTLARLLDQEGVSFSTLWREACLLHSKKLITEGHAFEDVAIRLGYADDRSFRRAFATWTGMSPSDFRRSPRKA